jgi:hypothetical protein
VTSLALRTIPEAGWRIGFRGWLRGPAPAWFALFLNVLTYARLTTLVPLPTSIGQACAQGALGLALLLALLANPAGLIRPNLFLVLLSMLAAVALLVSVHSQFPIGSTYRAVRLLAFTLALWLLTPWWGRADLGLLRAHLSALRVVLGTVLVGLAISPGKALSYEGRLSGILWPIPPTQVAHYAAVLLGCTVVLWFCGAVPGRAAAVTLVLGGGILLGTHTRTALLGLVIGLAVAGASLFLGHARVRRTSALVGVLVVVATTFFAPFIIAWLSRGQSAQEAAQLTGRTKVWTAIFQLHRSFLEQWFGSGLSNKSFNGLPIDSNWFASYLDEGWFGISIQIMILLALILIAVTHPRGLRRAVALFLVAYCLTASFSETGLGDASPYLLDLTIAAALLASAARGAAGP